MTVTGLPAAADTALSTLLSTETLSSWKIDATGQQTVVVLRFTTSGPPYAVNNAQSRYRLKPPSQIRRDSSRLQKHRELMKSSSTYLSSGPHDIRASNIPCDSGDIPVTSHCMSEPSELPPVTSDPPPSSQCDITLPCKLPPVTSDPPPSLQCEIRDKNKIPTDENDSAVPETLPPLFEADEDFLGLRAINKQLQQIKDTMQACVETTQGGKTSERGAGICERYGAVDSDVEFLSNQSPSGSQSHTPVTTHACPTTSQDTKSELQQDCSHGDRPSLTRPRRKRTTRRT